MSNYGGKEMRDLRKTAAASDKEFVGAGQKVGLEIWRVSWCGAGRHDGPMDLGGFSRGREEGRDSDRPGRILTLDIHPGGEQTHQGRHPRFRCEALAEGGLRVGFPLFLSLLLLSSQKD